MANCILCLEGNWPADRILGIFSEEGMNLNVSNIICKHFWIKPRERDEICFDCWNAVKDFNKFYTKVAESHKQFRNVLPVIPISDEDDPLPLEMELKSDDLNSAGKLIEALGDNFFESEVKVEVNDLEFLPQIEVIEDGENFSVCNILQGKDEIHDHADIGRSEIKREEHILKHCLNDSTEKCENYEPEFPLAVLVNTDVKADFIARDLLDDAEIEQENKELQKKKRGRPRKEKSEKGAHKEFNISCESLKSGSLTTDSDEVSQSAKLLSGTEESCDNNDSDESWTDSRNHHFEIPKKIVLKPKKKYSKRPKRLVPPRRMTRDEIDRKKAQQIEFDITIEKFFKTLTCPKCNFLVQNFSDIRQHFRMVHNEEPGYLMCCGRKFHQRKALAEHAYVHCNPEHFKCFICDRVFKDSRTFETHEATHSKLACEKKEKKVFQCDQCAKTFSSKAAWEHHSSASHIPKSEFKFTCPECNKKFPTERRRKEHIKYSHDPESTIICDKCGRQFRSHSTLRKHHLLEHSDVPRPEPIPVQCEICGTWLRHMTGLKQHMRTIHENTGIEHRCHICNKTSTNARALKRHIYHNHECERKFKCTMCEKAFKRPQDLREHTSTHTGEVLYTCPNCPMTFFSNANMYKHRQRLHRAEWEADRKKPVPPNIMQQAVGATAAMKMRQAMGGLPNIFTEKS